MEIARRDALPAYVTRDGSEICGRIPPETVRRLRADPGAPLGVVCSCAPPYAHEDTFLVEEA